MGQRQFFQQTELEQLGSHMQKMKVNTELYPSQKVTNMNYKLKCKS